MQKSTNLKAGDVANIKIERDTGPRILKVPEDFRKALQSNPLAGKTFERYSYSHQKEWLNWIEEAKKPETRQRRIDKVVQELLEKKP